MQKTAFQLIKGHLLKRKSMVFDLKISEFLSKNQRNKTIKQKKAVIFHGFLKNNTEYFSRIKKQMTIFFTIRIILNCSFCEQRY